MKSFSRTTLPILMIATTLFLSACGASPASTPLTEGTEEPASASISGKLIIYSGRSEPLVQPVLDAFGTLYPEVQILLKSGKNSELANALIEEQFNPQADIFITTELFTIQALYQKGLFLSYRPAAADLIPAEFVGPENSWVGLTQRARVIIYNTDLVSTEEAPKSIFDLTDPKWKGQIAAAGSTNGSMQAQIAAMLRLVGEQTTQQWLTDLLANEVTFFGGHTDVRKAVGAGEFKIGLVNHYYYYLQLAEGSPVGIVFPDQGEGQIGLLSNATSAAIIKGSANPSAAQAFIDFLLSPEGQRLFAELNYEYPLVPGVSLHEKVQSLSAFRLADVNVSDAALELDATLNLIETVGLP